MIFCIILSGLLLFGCNPVNEYNRGYLLEQDTELGNILILVREDTAFNRCVGSNSEKKFLQEGAIIQYHDRYGKIDTVKTWGGSKVIDSHVNRKGSGNVFILVEQKPLDSIFGKTIIVKEGYLYRPNLPSTVDEMYSMIRNSQVKKYWIVNKLTDDIYGPLEYEEYVILKNKFSIPNTIKLEFPR